MFANVLVMCTKVTHVVRYESQLLSQLTTNQHYLWICRRRVWPLMPQKFSCKHPFLHTYDMCVLDSMLWQQNIRAHSILSKGGDQFVLQHGKVLSLFGHEALYGSPLDMQWCVAYNYSSCISSKAYCFSNCICIATEVEPFLVVHYGYLFYVKNVTPYRLGGVNPSILSQSAVKLP